MENTEKIEIFFFKLPGNQYKKRSQDGEERRKKEKWGRERKALYEREKKRDEGGGVWWVRVKEMWLKFLFCSWNCL